jgi:hypothetical protein
MYGPPRDCKEKLGRSRLRGRPRKHLASRFVTEIVTVSPSFHRSVGPGTEPFTPIAVRNLPVKLTGSLSMVRLNSVPLSSEGAWVRSAAVARHGPHATRPAATIPCKNCLRFRPLDKMISFS